MEWAFLSISLQARLSWEIMGIFCIAAMCRRIQINYECQNIPEPRVFLYRHASYQGSHTVQDFVDK